MALETAHSTGDADNFEVYGNTSSIMLRKAASIMDREAGSANAD
jgi:hypothetical protein